MNDAGGSGLCAWRGCLLFAGAALVGSALLANEWFIAVLLSPDGRLGVGNRTIIWSAGIISFSVGVALLLAAWRSRGSPRADFVYVARHHKNKTLLALSASVFALTWAVLELGTWGFNRMVEEVSWVEVSQRGFFMKDCELGYSPRPNCQVRSTKRTRKRVIFDALYTIDGSGRRVTPSSTPNGGAGSVFFFGGSFTFGEGVNDDETFPHSFGARLKVCAVYNCAFSGYGPQHMLVLLEGDRLDALLDNRRAIGLYTFIDGHIQRATGSMRVMATWGGVMPCYVLGANGRPRRVDQNGGGFLEARPIRSVAYTLLARSQVLRFFNVDYPFAPRDCDVELTASIIEESGRLFQKKSAGGALYVAFYPGSQMASQLVPRLEGAGIRCLDYSGLFPRGDAFVIKGDRHPTPQAHRAMAEALARDIGPQISPHTEP